MKANSTITIVAGVTIAVIACIGITAAGILIGYSIGSVRAGLRPSTPVAILAESPPTTAPTEPQQPTATEPPQPTPVTPLDPRTDLKTQLEAKLGSGNRKVARLKELNFDDPEPDAIFISWAIDDNLTEDWIRNGAKRDAAEILQILAQSNVEFTYVILTGSFPLKDTYGNVKETNVVNLTFNQATLQKINWPTFDSANIYLIADEAHIWVQFQDGQD